MKAFSEILTRNDLLLRRSVRCEGVLRKDTYEANTIYYLFIVIRKKIKGPELPSRIIGYLFFINRLLGNKRVYVVDFDLIDRTFRCAITMVTAVAVITIGVTWEKSCALILFKGLGALVPANESTPN